MILAIAIVAVCIAGLSVLAFWIGFRHAMNDCVEDDAKMTRQTEDKEISDYYRDFEYRGKVDFITLPTKQDK